MLRMTHTERLSLAVAEAIVAQHLGIEEYDFIANSVDLKPSRRLEGGLTIFIKTVEYHEHPSRTFVVEVGHTPDDAFEFEAELYIVGIVVRKFWWDICGPKINLLENRVL